MKRDGRPLGRSGLLVLRLRFDGRRNLSIRDK